MGNSDTRVYFQCTSIVVFRCMAGLCVLMSFPKSYIESLVAIHNSLFN